MADEAVQRLHKTAESVVVTSRRELGSEAARGLAQSAVAGGVRRDLAHSHVYLAPMDANSPHKHAVIRLILTSTAAQEVSGIGNFQEILRTVRSDVEEEA